MTRSTAHRVAFAIRALIAMGLLLLLYFGVRSDSSDGAEIRLTGEMSATALARELAAIRPGSLVYTDSIPPTHAVATLMSAATQLGRDVSLVVPDRPAGIRVRPPEAPRALRRTALSITVRGSPDSVVRLSVEDDAGASDSIDVSVGPDGVGSVDLGIEPARAGLTRWTVRDDVGGVAHAAAWVRPADPLDVLILGSAPDWEVRYLIRALEAGGARVSVRQAVGPGLAVTSSEDPPPSTLAGLAPFDVVVTTTSDGYDDLLHRWVVERGGGVLLLRRDAESRRVSDAAEVRWTAPAEWLPLPPRAIDVAATPVASAADATGAQGVAIATLGVSGQVIVSAAAPGRGRLVLSGLDTWPWILEGGAGQGHSDYWHSVMEWLANGLRSDARLEGEPTFPYEAWRGRLDRGAGTRATLRFVPTREGAIPVRTQSGDTVGAAITVPGDERLDWMTAAMTVGRAGGALLPSSVRSTSGATPLGGDRRRDWPLFLLFGLLMTGGWAARRVTGLP